MKSGSYAMQSAAATDVVFLVDLAPASLTPVSIAEMHLYAYLANLVALNRGVPVSEWGYRFAVTTDGFPFAHALAEATVNLVGRSVLLVDDGHVRRDDLFDSEYGILNCLVQSSRRKSWLEDAFACALHLPRGAVREAINQSPGLATRLRDRRASVLLKEEEIEEIYDEFELVKEVLGAEAEDLLQPVVVWLSARVVSQGRP